MPATYGNLEKILVPFQMEKWRYRKVQDQVVNDRAGIGFPGTLHSYKPGLLCFYHQSMVICLREVRKMDKIKQVTV